MRRDCLRCVSRRAIAGAVLGLSLLGPSLARAQDQDAARLRLSLDAAVRRAERASDEILLARYGVDSARGRQLQARSGFFPQVSISASYERTLASEFDDVFSAPPAGEAEGSVNFGNLPFGRENVYRATTTVSQNLFAGGRTVAATEQAGAVMRQAELELTAWRAENALATAEAYYDALLGDSFVRIGTQTLAQAEVTLERVRLSRREGQESEFELLRAKVALDNERPNLAARRMERDLAYLRLRQRLSLPERTVLELTTSLDVADGAEAGAVAAGPATERLPVQQAREAVRASRSGVRGAQAGYYRART